MVDFVGKKGRPNRFEGTGDDDTALGREKSDTLHGAGGDDTIWGGRGADFLYGDAGDDSIEGGAGRDSISGGAGSDTLDGGDGDDTLLGGLGDDLKGGRGDDLIDASKGGQAFGGGGDDTILGGVGTYQAEGQDGDDFIDVRNGGEADGGDGADTILGAGSGGSGDDLLRRPGADGAHQSGGDGADTLIGDQHATYFSGADQWNDDDRDRDVIDARGGDDSIAAYTRDVVDGGDGVDFIELDFRRSDFDETVVLDESVTFANGAEVQNVERFAYHGGGGQDDVTGGALGDRLDGGRGADRLLGEGGDDVLVGGQQNDTLLGGTGDDILTGGSSADVVDGGDGDDVFYTFEWAFAGADVYDGGGGRDVVIHDATSDAEGVVLDLEHQSLNGGGFAGDVFSGIEVFNTSSFDDALRGDATANEFFSGGGDDILEGRAGDDYLYADEGDDVLSGGDGLDTLSGYQGADTFDLTGPAPAYASRDLITDFSRAEGDKLRVDDLDGADFSLQFGTDATGADATYVFDADSHRLWFDADGAGGAAKVLKATLEDVTTLDRSDFLLA